MQDAKEEVRARLAIEDVIGEYVELKRAGRSFKGLSPFSGERTPSFFVSPEKNIWHDFSSNKGGDVFSFVMEAEGLDFKGALELLARKANVDLSLYQNDKARDIAAKKKRLRAANEAAAHFFQHSMLQNQHAVEYVFKKRAINRETAAAFRLGYAPEGGDMLVKYLTNKGFTRKELQDAGLTNRFGGDLFKGRMMVPLMDGAGEVIGFTGRIIRDDPKAPKYLNTPATLLYDKSWHVFGLSQAKEAMRTRDYVVVVEGNLDVVSSWQAGVKQVVATAGTAMTLHHLKTMGRLTGNIRLSFDGDKAGIAATERAIPIAEEAGVSLTIISLPDGAKDPDELIQQSVASWQAAIDTAEPVVDWILRQYSTRHDVSTAAGKRAFTTAALEVTKALKDPVEQEHYLQKIAEVSNTTLETLQRKMSTREEPDKQYKKVAHVDTSNDESRYAHHDSVLALGLVDSALHELFANTESALFVGEKRQAVAAYLRTSHGALQDTPEELQKYDEYVKILLLRADARYAGWTDTDRFHEAARLLRRIKDEHKKQQKQQLTDQLRDAEASGDETRVRELMQAIQTLNKEIHS
ncbi:DNA primase [Candidatus Mycosynbacter amalyticus]|uniref:DNA primase n=1 Tax=Candidatus Mycosynbacter amalyticus TaxID=2665156 RepID=A0A857MM61_9BACT|nr:DNA primase [Candidatus Mycosynbacter amalyticus]QHN42359.1 DNA primase [Candidatus Mycosynbacter amalyticus]